MEYTNEEEDTSCFAASHILTRLAHAVNIVKCFHGWSSKVVIVRTKIHRCGTFWSVWKVCSTTNVRSFDNLICDTNRQSHAYFGAIDTAQRVPLAKLLCLSEVQLVQAPGDTTNHLKCILRLLDQNKSSQIF